VRTILLAVILSLGPVSLLKAQSSDDTLCTPGTLQIDNSLLNVFPNPTDGTFKIIYASNTNCPPPGWGGLLLINIINENGITVFTESIQDFEGEYIRTIDLTGKPTGEYIIQIVAGNMKVMRREVLK